MISVNYIPEGNLADAVTAAQLHHLGAGRVLRVHLVQSVHYIMSNYHFEISIKV